MTIDRRAAAEILLIAVVAVVAGAASPGAAIATDPPRGPPWTRPSLPSWTVRPTP